MKIWDNSLLSLQKLIIAAVARVLKYCSIYAVTFKTLSDTIGMLTTMYKTRTGPKFKALLKALCFKCFKSSLYIKMLYV